MHGYPGLEGANPTPPCVQLCLGLFNISTRAEISLALMILPQVHLRKPCYDFYFL